MTSTTLQVPNSSSLSKGIQGASPSSLWSSKYCSKFVCVNPAPAKVINVSCIVFFTFSRLHSTNLIEPWRPLLGGLVCWASGFNVQPQVATEIFLIVLLLLVGLPRCCLSSGSSWILLLLGKSSTSVEGCKSCFASLEIELGVNSILKLFGSNFCIYIMAMNSWWGWRYFLVYGSVTVESVLIIKLLLGK